MSILRARRHGQITDTVSIAAALLLLGAQVIAAYEEIGTKRQHTPAEPTLPAPPPAA